MVALLLLALAVYACASRVVVVDSISGAPIEAQVEALDGGRLLVEASGYEMWSGPAQARIELHPLWLRRFTDEAPVPRPASPPCASCPGTRSR